MKKALQYSFIFILFLIAVHCSYADWSVTNGPSGGTIHSIVANGTNLYAATDAGVFRSTNQGQSWFIVSVMPGGAISLVISNNTIIAASGTAGFFRSSDNGGTWQSDSAIVGGVYSTVAFAADGQNITAQVDSKEYISADGGVGWTYYTPAAYPMNVFTVSGGNLYGGNEFGVNVSTDHGVTWTTIQLTAKTVLSLVVNGNVIIAGMDSSAINYSTNGGKTWEASRVGTRGKDVTTLYQFGMYVFAGTRGDGIFVTSTNGATWSSENSSMSGTEVLSFASVGTQVFAGLNGYGVVVTPDTNKTWSGVNTILNGMAINSLTANNGGVYAGTTGGGVQRTNDNGVTWTSGYGGMQDTNGYIPPVNVLADSGVMLYAGTATRGVYYSSNNGVGWHAVGKGLPGMDIQAIAAKSSYVFAAVAENNVYRASNTTFTWSQSNTELGGDFPFIYALADAGNGVFAATAGGMMMTSDNGGSWSIVNNGFPCATCVTKPVTHALIGSGTDVYIATDSGVFRSTDNGTSWFLANSGLEGQILTSMTSVAGDVFVGTASGGVFLSSDNGATWTATNTGLIDMSVTALGISNGYLYAAAQGMNSGSAMWQRALADFGIVGVQESKNTIPTELSLAQNYPNPFSSTTTISFTADNVSSLKVYDALGRQVADLTNQVSRMGHISPTGSRTVEFDASALPTGMYYYRLAAGKFSQCGKMEIIQ